ncbi:MAG: endonuclease/exonuclease/phosphatase family protein, partial [Planctomycetota bacterium]
MQTSLGRRWVGALLFALVLTAGTGQAQTLDRRHMTWNVGTINPFSFRLPKRREGRVVERLALHGADTVTLQELRDVAQVQRLKDGLLAQGHDYAFETFQNNPSRNDGRLVATFYKGEQLAQRLEFRSSAGYGALGLQFQSGWTLVNVHAPAGFYTPRRVYFQELATWIDGLQGKVVLAGDLNLGPRHGAGIGAFLPWARRYDRDTYAAFITHFDEYTDVGSTTFYGFHLDHVLVRGGVIRSAQRFKGYGRLPMDHRPVLAELQLGQTTGITGTLTG